MATGRCNIHALAALASLLTGTAVISAPPAVVKPPEHVDVLPVFFVPYGTAMPTKDQIERLSRHLAWAQSRYAELLPGHCTFTIADRKPLVFRVPHQLAFYRPLPANAAPQMTAELLRQLRYTRVNCPYVFVTVVMNPQKPWPGGGGQPFNGEFDTGGGIVVISSNELDGSPNFQSTLQHELGHAFGLPHVDVYSIDMTTSVSLMSYNPAHHTNGFEPSRTPGEFILEDVRGLSLNRRVFPALKDLPSTYVPEGYLMKPLVELGPMRVPEL